MLDSTRLHASCYADQARFVAAPIVENVPLAKGTWRLRYEAPDQAARIAPGQFVMLRLAGCDDPMLGRAFALYDAVPDESGTPRWVDIVYQVHGKLTTALAARQPGDRVEAWGPLGNGFEGSADGVDHLVLVAGGIGQTPFLACGKEALGRRSYGAENRKPLRAKKVTLCYGVRSADYLAGADDFRSAGMELIVTSDDGTIGQQGLVTDALRIVLEDSTGQSLRVACCGPEPMMRAVATVCRDAGAPCEVSLETPMACGIGACFSCVARVVQAEGDWDYKRTCVEGPVFDAEKIVW